MLLTGPSAAITIELSPLVQTHDLTNLPERIYSFQLDEIENFLKFVYYGKVSMESLDALRMNQFRCSTDNSPRTLSQSRDGLTEHIKSAPSRVVMNGEH